MGYRWSDDRYFGGSAKWLASKLPPCRFECLVGGGEHGPAWVEVGNSSEFPLPPVFRRNFLCGLYTSSLKFMTVPLDPPLDPTPFRAGCCNARLSRGWRSSWEPDGGEARFLWSSSESLAFDFSSSTRDLGLEQTLVFVLWEEPCATLGESMPESRGESSFLQQSNENEWFICLGGFSNYQLEVTLSLTSTPMA